MWQSVPQLKWGIGVVVVVLVVSLLSMWTVGTPVASSQYAKNLRSIVQQAIQLNTTAQQDSNTLVRLVHATTALSYLDAARMASVGRDLSKIARVNTDEIRQLLDASQKSAIQQVVQMCPAVKPTGAYVMGSGWV